MYSFFYFIVQLLLFLIVGLLLYLNYIFLDHCFLIRGAWVQAAHSEGERLITLFLILL